MTFSLWKGRRGPVSIMEWLTMGADAVQRLLNLGAPVLKFYLKSWEMNPAAVPLPPGVQTVTAPNGAVSFDFSGVSQENYGIYLGNLNTYRTFIAKVTAAVDGALMAQSGSVLATFIVNQPAVAQFAQRYGVDFNAPMTTLANFQPRGMLPQGNNGGAQWAPVSNFVGAGRR